MGFDNKYPYTDFHELNLDWFLQEFNKLLKEWADLAADNAEFKQTMTERFGTLSDTVHEFTTFVTNYFDNLDVQQEINNKLNDMVEDGTLSELLRPYFNAFTVEINARMRNQDDKIAVLEGRMDTFASLPDGSTAGDAELEDIRIGYDGTVYNSAGNAVRGQITDLHGITDTLYESLIDGALNFYNAGLKNGTIYSGGAPGDGANDYQVYTSTIQKFSFPVKICTKGNYRASVFYYSAPPMSNSTKQSVTLVRSDAPLTVPKDQYFGFYCYLNNSTDPLSVATALENIYIESILDKIPEMKTELENIRIGVDGTTYSTAGNAVRNQITDVKNNITEVKNEADTAIQSIQNGVLNFYSAGLKNGTIYSSGNPGDGANDYQVYTSTIQKFSFPVKICTKGNYRASVFYYSAPPMSSSTKQSNTLVRSDAPLTVPKDQYFGFYCYLNNSTDPLSVATALENIYIESAFDSLKANVDTLLEYKEYDGLVLPAYWNDYLETKIPELKGIEENLESGVEFVFITDVHMPRNAMNSPTIIRRIIHDTNMPFVINGGDWLDTSETKQEGLDLMYEWRSMMGNAQEFCVIGNHDLNQVNQKDPAQLIPPKSFYDVMIKPTEKDIISYNNLYYYMDNTNQKFRWIILSPKFDDTEKAWFKNKLTELDSTWTVLVISHYLWSNPTTFSSIGLQYIAAINEVYETMNATLIGILAGHAHFDTVQSESTYGYKLISTTTDTLEYDDLPKQRGTVNEHAFDAVYIDTTSKTMYMKRIGIGNNRTISYS